MMACDLQPQGENTITLLYASDKPYIRYLHKILSLLAYEFLCDGQKCALWHHSDLDLWPPKSSQFFVESK